MTLKEQFEQETGTKAQYSRDPLYQAQYELDYQKAYSRWLEKKVPCWISVEERMPSTRRVDVCYRTCGKLARLEWVRYAGRKFYDTSCETIVQITDQVTHWMPIPELPKEI